MKDSKLIEWIQILASLGVFVGLLLVAYQVSESNRVATAEGATSIGDSIIDIAISEYEGDINAIFAKSFESPRELTSGEILALGSWYLAILQVYDKWLVSHQLGTARYDGLDSLREVVDIYFSGKFGRAWFEQNRGWMKPEIANVIADELDSLPVRTAPFGVDEIRSRL